MEGKGKEVAEEVEEAKAPPPTATKWTKPATASEDDVPVLG